jgi:hypothetical protein
VWSSDAGAYAPQRLRRRNGAQNMMAVVVFSESPSAVLDLADCLAHRPCAEPRLPASVSAIAICFILRSCIWPYQRVVHSTLAPPKLILMARSVSQEFVHWQLRLSGVCRTFIVRLADFATSIKTDDKPTSFTVAHKAIRPHSIRRLLIERLLIPHAAADELWPFRHHRHRVSLFWQERLECGMMPTECMAAAVAMQTDALAQFLDFCHKFFTGHLVKVRIHNVLSPSRSDRSRESALWFQ